MHQEIRWLLIVGSVFVSTIFGCSNVDEEASTQTLRLRQTEQELSEELKGQGWELAKQGVMWGGKYTGNDLTPEMLRQLQGFQRFAELDVNDRELTQEHIQAISELDSLMKLHMAGTNVDNTVLDVLDACPQLMMIDLRGTKVTPARANAWVASRKTNNSISIFARNPVVQTGSR